jgi:Holliday junction resolvase RusA-like endonuclease
VTPVQPEFSFVRFVIEGCPRTKKNHLRRVRRGGRTFSVQSEAFEAWAEGAVPQLIRQKTKQRLQPIAVTVNLRALVYRERNHGDLVNFLSAICDVLQVAGVVVNDRLIVGHDGSRPLLDKKNPRVEIELTPLVLLG